MQIAFRPGVRPARRRELDDIAALICDAFTPFQKALPGHIFEPYVTDASGLSERWEAASIAVLETEGRLVGTVTYYPDAAREGMGWPPGLAGLRTLAVAPSARGLG